MVTRNYNGIGGHDIVINNLCLGLEQLGYEMTLGSFSFSRTPPSGIKIIKLQKISNIAYHNDIEFDIIHNQQTLMNYYSLFTSIPFIFHYHGTSSKLQEINLHMSLSLCRKKISRIISDSKSATEPLTKYSKDIPIDIVYCGVDPDFYNPDLPIKYNKGTPQLLFVGKLYSHKNVGLLIDLMDLILNSYPSCHLQIVGDGDDYKFLSNKIKQKNLEDKVELVGKLDPQELRFRYASCDVYVSASCLETFDIPVLEAMSCGKPVLISDIPAHQEILHKSKAGLTFSLSNKSDFINKLRKVYDKKQVFGNAGRNFAMIHNWQTTCKKVAEIYEQILQN